jgi:hypothetical protein
MNNSTRNRGKDQPAVGPPTEGLLGGHPVGTGLGAVAGGVAGKAIGDVIDTSAEEGYWREHFTSRPYVASGSKVVHSSRPNWI